VFSKAWNLIPGHFWGVTWGLSNEAWKTAEFSRAGPCRNAKKESEVPCEGPFRGIHWCVLLDWLFHENIRKVLYGVSNWDTTVHWHSDYFV
jgi:hypothetical protein